MKGNMWVIGVLIAVLGVGALSVPGLVSSNTETRTVTNESVELVENGTFLQEADSSTSIFENETVKAETNGTVLSSPNDYRIDYATGKISAANGSEFAGETILVNYSTAAPENARTEEIASLLSIANPVWPLLIVLAIFGTLLGLVGRMF